MSTLIIVLKCDSNKVRETQEGEGMTDEEIENEMKDLLETKFIDLDEFSWSLSWEAE